MKLSDYESALKKTGQINADLGGEGTTSSPSYLKLADTAGTARYFFPDTNGRLRVHTTTPTANTDGTVVDSSFADAITATSTTATYDLGTLREYGGKTYMYVQNIDLTASNGWALCAGNATNPYIVSGDATGGSAITTIPVGVAVGSIPQNSYAWILVRGVHTSVISDGSVTAGQGLIKHASIDGGVDSASAGSTETINVHQIFGKALANDTTSRVVALISTL